MPDWTQHVRPRLSGLRLSPTREAEIVEELSQHLEDRWRELIAGGATPDEATRVALADFRDGDLLARHMAPLRQAHSPEPITLGATSGHYFSDLLEDIRYGARMMNSINDIIVAARGLRKAPVFTSVAIISLALAIGSISTISAIV